MDGWIPRLAEARLEAALDDTPVVLVHGPRQVGKSSLVQKVAQTRGIPAITLDDYTHLEFAQTNPEAFLKAHGTPLLIDEIQRAPALLLAMKAAVDRDRQPGRYLLTGSANVLMLPKVADSLAGRMEIIDLLPISLHERGGGSVTWVERAFAGQMPKGSTQNLVEWGLRGGFPEASARLQPKRRDAWFQGYVRSLLERDVRDLAQIQGLTQMPRLLRAIAHRVGETLNLSAFSRETGVPHTTLERYFDLLRSLFLVRTLPPWTQEPAQAYIRSPKVYLADTGLLAHLTGADAKRIETDPRFARSFYLNLLFQEFSTQVQELDVRMFHLRTVRHREVDFVFENGGGEIVGVLLSDSPSPRRSDAEPLLFLRELSPQRFRRGILLYSGSERVVLDEGIEAWPLASLKA
jgi:uncharacterized protein